MLGDKLEAISMRTDAIRAVSQERREDLVDLVESEGSWKEVKKWVLEKNILGLPGSALRGIPGGVEPEEYDIYRLIAGLHAEKKPRTKSEFARQLTENAPGTVVEKEGKTYVINGVPHIGPYRSVMKQIVGDAHLVVEEPGMKQFYNGENCIEQARKNELKYVPGIRFGKGRRDNASATKGWSLLLWGTQKSMEDLREVRSGAVEGVDLSDYNLPPALEADYMRGVMATGEESNSQVMLRSLAQAEFLENIAKESDEQITHWLGGYIHESEIAFYLRNPEFAQEIGKQYRQEHERLYVPPIVKQLAIMGSVITVVNGSIMGPFVPGMISAGHGELIAVAGALVGATPALTAYLAMRIIHRLPPTNP